MTKIDYGYEYVGFAKSVSHNGATKEEASSSTKTQFEVICDCGVAMELRQCAYETCNDCKDNTLDEGTYGYECLKGINSELHRSGFKICYQCGEKRWKKLQEKRKTETKENDSKEDISSDDEEHLIFPNKLGFDIKKIEELKLKDFYDSKVYLSNLMVVASIE